MTRLRSSISPQGRIRRLVLHGAAAIAAMLVIAVNGCVTITVADIDDGSDAGSEYRVVLSCKATQDSANPVRGVVAIRIPVAWEVTSVAFSDGMQGLATRSAVMEEIYATEWETAVGPGYSGHKAGYGWWVGYSPAGTWFRGDESEVTFLIDTHGRGGGFSLDFVTGIADKGPALEDIEDAENDHALWYLGSAGTRPSGVILDQAVTLYSFTDVHPTTDYYGAIQGMASRGLVGGYPVGGGYSEFRPANPVFRAQFAKMIDGALGLSVEETMAAPVDFRDLGRDVADDLYPHEYIWTAYAHNMIKGYSNGLFKPYAPVSRGQVITMVVRALQALHPNTLLIPTGGFAQTWGRGLSPEHRANAAIAEYNGLLAGLALATTSADGNAPMPRGEVAQVLWNMMAFVAP